MIERRRPEHERSSDWLERQQRKIDAGVAQLAQELDDKAWCNGEGYTLADIATGCALGYLDLRRPELDWRGDYPNLARLADKLFRRPAFVDTVPVVA